MTGAALALALLAARPEPPVTVGSKSFTESVLLGEMAAQLLADAGIPARHERALGGTRILWEALVRGEIDVYPDYTGTLAREILGAREPLDEAGLRAALAPLGVGLTRPLGFENTYAVGVRREVAERLGLSRISDLSRHPELRVGLTNEFLDRADGWPALRAAYRLPHRDVRGLDHDLAYRAIGSGEIDVTDVYTTDAQILRLDLVLLQDDRRVFPRYQAVLVHRADLSRRSPEALEALRRLEGRLSREEMISLNARAQLRGDPPPVVAAEWLGREMGIAAGVPPEALPARLLRRTLEHLALVAAALLGAIAAALPLGILAARRPGAGRIVLGAVGVVQTVPSLALLVFMIPLLGIGAAPAVAALFLYGLLPIVRNTHAGLVGIAPELRESALALGLPSLARLRLVELPLAAPAILAGVKTSAVITVGTATLGALIGAGGYGQPILTGIRLASVPLILEGAVPAAALALLAQGAFDRLERALVPRGLRLGADAGRRSRLPAAGGDQV
ncbi:MAG TPA: glycine betaine ABC transporter substrate-binding protein [Anaeromyxobacteraceae bacterium]|nr:glycine betaine ABC transporter substrate-binding protein [Anaeromyxobacteraceae bacterium]